MAKKRNLHTNSSYIKVTRTYIKKLYYWEWLLLEYMQTRIYYTCARLPGLVLVSMWTRPYARYTKRQVKHSSITICTMVTHQNGSWQMESIYRKWRFTQLSKLKPTIIQSQHRHRDQNISNVAAFLFVPQKQWLDQNSHQYSLKPLIFISR